MSMKPQNVAQVSPTATIVPSPSPQKTSPVITTAEGGEISEKNLQRLEQGIVSADLALNKSVLIKDIRKNLTMSPIATPGATFVFDRKTFKANQRYGSIEGDVSWGSSFERYMVWLLKEQDGAVYQWNIVTTISKSEYEAAQ